MAFIWDQANSSHGTDVISGGGLNVYRNNPSNGTISRTNSRIPATGKWYFEIVGIASNGAMGGISDPAWDDDPAAPGAGALLAPNGANQCRLYKNGSDPLYGVGINAGDIIGIAYDATQGRIWFAVNNAWVQGDPAADSSPSAFPPAGTYYPSAGFLNDGAAYETALRVGANVTYSAPAGFTVIIDATVYTQSLMLGYALKSLEPFQQALNLGYSLLTVMPSQQALNLAYKFEADAVWTPVVTAIHYTLKLVASGYSDLVLPMSSFQSRLRQSTPSYLQVVVPSALNYVDEITDRSAGHIVIERGLRWTDGTTQTTEIARVNFETLRIDQGATNDSATLTGHKTTTNSSPKSVTLTGAQTRSLSGSSIRYRCAIDNTLRPGDTAHINNDSFIVKSIQFVVSTAEEYMEIENGG